MPKAPPRLKRERAPEPKRISWATTKGKRLTGSANQKARRELFKEEPLCRECLKRGRVSVAAIRDHIKAIDCYKMLGVCVSSGRTD